MQEIDVEVKDVKFMGAPANFLQYHYLVWQVIPDSRVKPERDIRACH
jgi:hypothetical protein